jgi:peptidyl-tRNA hydrolase
MPRRNGKGPKSWKGKRIYCIVAKHVVTPMGWHVDQPPGRLAAQAAHAVSKARLAMARKQVDRLGSLGRLHDDEWWDSVSMPITTIVLGARDIKELLHVEGLLYQVGIPVYLFYDTDQPDYGGEHVCVLTALATEPVDEGEVAGILDYLPLWSPE